MIPVLTALLCLSFQSAPAPRPNADADVRALLARALEAAGGVEALKRARVLEWRGTATVFAGARQIRLAGHWTVEGPDRARVETWEIEKGESSTRRLILDGDKGWMERDGKTMPMPPEMLANERDQFYLYVIVKILLLTDPAVALSPVRVNGEMRGLEVKQNGRNTVQIFFDDAGRPTHLTTTVLDPSTGNQLAEEMQFQGVIESAGVRWPRRILIKQAGALFFELEITEFAVR
jgi:hypothetical protein